MEYYQLPQKRGIHWFAQLHCGSQRFLCFSLLKGSSSRLISIKISHKRYKITIEELRPFLEKEIYNQYNLDYIQHEVIPKYSKGEYRGEGKLAYKNVPSPIWGLFTNCIKLPEAPDALALKVNLDPNGYVYYTELKRFFLLVMENFSDKQKDIFQKEVIDKFLTRNKNVILSIKVFFYFKKWQIELFADPESDVPLPMVIIRKKRKILFLIVNIISIFQNMYTSIISLLSKS